MELFPDHPVIRNMEHTGYPDGKEPVEYRCPICGFDAENYYVSRRHEVIGCENCIETVPYYEIETEEFE